MRGVSKISSHCPLLALLSPARSGSVRGMEGGQGVAETFKTLETCEQDPACERCRACAWAWACGPVRARTQRVGRLFACHIAAMYTLWHLYVVWVSPREGRGQGVSRNLQDARDLYTPQPCAGMLQCVCVCVCVCGRACVWVCVRVKARAQHVGRLLGALSSSQLSAPFWHRL